MSEYVEFYVSCNPPLVPNGVSSVITHIREELQSKVVEILYEPEIPWFKLITTSEDQVEVTTRLESDLGRILEEETDLIDEEYSDAPDVEGDDIEPRADVDILPDEPQVIPWSLYQYHKYGYFQKCEDEFPEHIKNLPYKAVWRGLESFDTLTISSLLSNFDFLWARPDLVSGLQNVEELTKCRITHNLSGNLIYIGSGVDASCIAAAIRKLENLLSFHNSFAAYSSHLVFTESEDTQKLSFRWLTHVGLDKLTYVNDPFSGEQREGQLLNRACIRVDVVNARGHLEVDKTVYPVGSELHGSFYPTNRAFADFKYRVKPADSGPISEPNCSFPMFAAQQQQCARSSQAMPEAGSNALVTTSTRSKNPLTSGIFSALEVQSTKASDSFNEKNTAKTQQVESTSDYEVPRRSNVIFTPKQLLRTSIKTACQRAAASVHVPMTTADTLTSWIDEVEAIGLRPPPDCLPELQPGTLTDSTTSLVDDLLIDLEHETESLTRPRNGDSSALGTNQLLGPGDLIHFGEITTSPIAKVLPQAAGTVSLLDSRAPPGLSYGMFAPMNLLSLDQNQPHSQAIPESVSPRTGVHGNNLMDSSGPPIYTLALMDNPPASVSETDGDLEARENDVVPTFGKIESNEKKLYNTMIQRAAPKQTWASIASQPKSQSKEDKPFFGANVATRILPGPTAGPRELVGQGVAKRPAKTISLREMPGHRKGPSVRTATSSDQGNKASPDGNKSNTPRSFGANALKAKSQQINPPNGGRKTVPGMDAEPTGQPDFSAAIIEALRNAETKAQDLLKLLQVTPGHIQVEAKLGRICVDVEQSLVNLGEGPSWGIKQVIERLNSADDDTSRDEQIGFHPILTTNGAEADLLPGMALAQGLPWTLFEKQVCYIISCKNKDDYNQMVIEMDASTFQHICQSPRQELPGLFIHCAKRAWDMKLSVSRAGFSEVPAEFRHFAECFVKSLDISIDNGGQVVIAAKPDETSRWYVEGMHIRHLAKYRSSPKSLNYLAVVMTRVVRKVGQSYYHGTTRQASSPGQGTLDQWFEASIRSTRAEELLKENIGLEFGNKTAWTLDQFRKQDIIKALCKPAMEMVNQMDQIGQTNHHNEGPKFGRRGLKTLPNSDKDYVFW
ncbi:hypothetical protein AK830_g4992 [Neonectria ditissima]|uniref:Uncharacterized protein n=1 Tax=Neonectria ditissima TaxID=78410 RepID=A0A0P7AUM5_9HYPO|nr:hypothetical protein AK830_g4992 [Neonectria ditissima]